MRRKGLNTDIDFNAVCDQWIAANKGKRNPTINDVARLAGVSKKTVSRVINESELVKTKTLDIVRFIIDRIGYHPDPQARGLAFRRSFLIGLIYDNPNPQYVVNMQVGILDCLKHTEFELVVHPCDRKSVSFVEDSTRFIETQKLFGAILTPSVSEDERLAKVLSETRYKYIRIASIPLDSPERMIVTNDRVGGKAAARHLVELGHTRIALLTGVEYFFASKERRAGFEEGLQECGLSLRPEYVLKGDFTFDSGLAAGKALLELNPRPTAIFAENDEMAAGVLQAFNSAGLQVPDSLSIIGYDDFSICTRVWPRLTTIHSPTRKVGELAAASLLGFKENEQGRIIQRETTPFLVIRESTRKIL